VTLVSLPRWLDSCGERWDVERLCAAGLANEFARRVPAGAHSAELDGAEGLIQGNMPARRFCVATRLIPFTRD
jgi:hypothetical protein